MARVDLHVHSKYSQRPSEWFLQKLGTRESYTDPEALYQEAMKSGMDFVTITDHNTIEGSLLLKEKHPGTVFTGVEVTSYFPEDRCKIHVLVYDLDERQFREIDRIREDVYHLRDYIRKENLAHSLAHATYSVNGKLSADHLEKLILLFDIFEGINGSRDRYSNEQWMRLLRNLTPDHMERFYRKHRIEPFSTNSWIKGFTAGSDDHAGLFIGKTYGSTNAATPAQFVEKIKNRETDAGGRFSDYRSLVFTIYKIAYDFSRSRNTARSDSILGALTETIVSSKPDKLSTRLTFQKLKLRKKSSFSNKLVGLFNEFQKGKELDIDEKLRILYSHISEISDDLLLSIIKSLKKELSGGDLAGIIKVASSSIPGLFLSVPFFTSLRHMHRSRPFITELGDRMGMQQKAEDKTILWFTDTIADLNGISGTIRKLGWLAHEKGSRLKIVVSAKKEDLNPTVPPNVVVLDPITSYSPSFYDSVTMNIPSLLKSLKVVCEQQPDEIIISTPGVVGLLGLLTAKLLNIKSVGIYHTDFTRQADEVIGDELMSNVVEMFTKWFYMALDEIRVPTREYISILKARGFDPHKMTLFNRGIESDDFVPDSEARERVGRKYGVGDGILMLYTGRIGKEKSLGFLSDVLHQLQQKHDNLHLVLVGNGPHVDEIKQQMSKCRNVLFTGRLDREELPELYAAADIFLFPSVTDTFGMSVLEAQSCGVPAVVSDAGGPKEIVINGRTGHIAKRHDLEDWVRKTESLIHQIRTAPEIYMEMRCFIREYTKKTYDWNRVLEELTGCASIQSEIHLPEPKKEPVSV
ncbi:MAG: glycosyltransferase [Chitinispirillaceae bacterium]